MTEPAPMFEPIEPAPVPTPTLEPIEPASEVVPVVPVEPVEPVVPVEPVEPVAPVSPPGRPPRASLRLAGYLVAAAAGAALLFSGLAATGSLVPLQASPSPSTSPSPSPGYMQGAALGDPSAPVTIEVWADYQCPYCGLQSRGVEPSLERTVVATGQARLVFRDFAFLGQESIDAAVAARCAGSQGAYWYFHDLLFSSQQGENQGAFARARLLSLASFASLDAKTFTACLDDTAVSAAVQAETEAGRRLGVASTPTVRITGPGGAELLDGVKPLADVEAAVTRVSKPSSSPTPGPSTSATAGPSPSRAGASPTAPSASP